MCLPSIHHEKAAVVNIFNWYVTWYVAASKFVKARNRRLFWITYKPLGIATRSVSNLNKCLPITRSPEKMFVKMIEMQLTVRIPLSNNDSKENTVTWSNWIPSSILLNITQQYLLNTEVRLLVQIFATTSSTIHSPCSSVIKHLNTPIGISTTLQMKFGNVLD